VSKSLVKPLPNPGLEGTACQRHSAALRAAATAPQRDRYMDAVVTLHRLSLDEMEGLLKQSSLLLAVQSDKNCFHPEQFIRLRFKRDGSVYAHQNPGHRLMDRLPHFAIHPTAKLLRHPSKVPFERRGDKLNHG
jgi:hypothetical protein